MPAAPRALDGAGTPEDYWAACGHLDRLVRWEPVPAASGRVVVVSPHPDDEILGVGGTVARLSGAGRVGLVAVTDGEAAYPGRAEEMRRRRPAETTRAFEVLGVELESVVRLGLADGQVSEGVAGRLADHIGPGDLVLAPWIGDGHPDHDAVGVGARQAASARGATVMGFLVWAWHWARTEDLPWADLVRVDLDPATTRAKRGAVACFASQLDGPEPVLSTAVLARLTRPFEVLHRP